MRSLLIIIILTSLISSCTPPLYIPNTANVPSLTKKGDVEIAGYTGTNGYDVQLAAAPTKEFGIMFNGSYANTTSDELSRYHKHLFSEFGIGYTYEVDQDTHLFDKPKTLFNCFAGGGLGNSEGYVNFSNIFNSSQGYQNAIRGNYYRAFIQPSIGISSKSLDFYFTLKASYVKVYDLETSLDADWNNSYISDDDYNLYQSYFTRKNFNIFYEPTFTLKGGSEQFKFITQFGISAGQYTLQETTFKHRPIIFIIGIQGEMNLFK